MRKTYHNNVNTFYSETRQPVILSATWLLCLPGEENERRAVNHQQRRKRSLVLANVGSAG